MAALPGEFAITCPACGTPIVLPLTQAGASLMSVTLIIDLVAMREHIATAHPEVAASTGEAVTGGQPAEPVERQHPSQ